MKTKKQTLDVFLYRFLLFSDKLENLYLVNRNEFSKEWIEKKISLAKQSLSIYKFGNDLVLNKENNRLYFFYLDLIMSKLKHSIFTETPKSEKLDIFPFIFKEDIYYTAKRLYEIKNYKDFDIDFQRLVFKLFLMYDFIFYKENGVFTRFKLNKTLFYKVKNVFKFKNNGFRMFGSNLIKNYLNDTLNFYGKRTTNPYKEFVEAAQNKQVFPIEPLSYYLAYKIWKFSKMIRSTLEFKDLKERENYKIEFYKKIHDYISYSLDNIQQFYGKKINNLQYFSNMAKIDFKILDDIMKDILKDYQQEDYNYEKYYKNENFYFNEEKEFDIGDILKFTINNKSYEKYKFYRVLENNKVTVEDITALCEALISNEKTLKDYDLIAMARGGILPAHIINVIKKLNKVVYIFSSYPYISILPRTLFSKSHRVIVIDESIKSGFSFKLFAIYKKRLLSYKTSSFDEIKFNYKLFSFVDFIDFNSDKSMYNLKKIADIKVEKEENDKEILKIQNTKTIKLFKLFDWKKYFNYLEQIIEPKKLKEIVKINNRLDVTRLLSLSDYYFYIGSQFAKYVFKNKKSNNIILFSTTDEGRGLCFATAFALKSLYPDEELNIVLDPSVAIKNKKEGIFFIDMTIDSMFTINRSFELDFDDKEKLYLNKALVIFASKKAKQDLGNKIISLDNLRE